MQRLIGSADLTLRCFCLLATTLPVGVLMILLLQWVEVFSVRSCVEWFALGPLVHMDHLTLAETVPAGSILAHLRRHLEGSRAQILELTSRRRAAM